MARIAGRRGRIYLAVASGAAASPIPFFNTWSINHTTDKLEVTAFEDANKTYLSGLTDAQGAFSGFYDDATAQTYTAAVDGLARNFYLYPNAATNTQYWFGTIIVDMTVDGSVTDAIKVSTNWNAATQVQKIG